MQKWYEWLEKNEKKKMRRRETSTKSGANDEECGGKLWTLAQNHEAYSMERSTDPEERRRRCKVVRPL